jgi:periplasmic protein TonB
MQESVGVLSFPSLGAAPQLDLPPPHREPWSLNAAAVAAALLVHALVLLFLLWPFLTSMLWPEKPPPTEVAIPITIVQEPPKPPPPPAPRQQEPRARRSGPEEEGGVAESGKGKAEAEETTAPEPASPPAPPPPPEATESPEPSSPPEVASPPAPAVTESAGAPPSAEQSAATPLQLPLPAMKPPTRPKHKPEQKTAQVPASVARRAGDRYLNSVRDRIERVRSYPPLARGRQLRGVAIYAVTVDRAGRLLDIRLLESSGYDMLDREGERMIRAAAPLPALPGEVAAGRTEVQFGIDIPLYPN